MPFYSGQTDYITELNKLADTETNTFSPFVRGTTLAGLGTYNPTISARYTKLANTITFAMSLTWSAHTGTGNLLVGGLPFTSLNEANLLVPVTVYYSNITATAATVLGGFISPNTTLINLTQVTAGGAAVAVPMDGAGTLYISGTYFV